MTQIVGSKDSVQRKRKLAEQALWRMGDSTADVSGVTRGVEQPVRGGHAIIADSMAEQFRRDALTAVTPGPNTCPFLSVVDLLDQFDTEIRNGK